MARLRSSRAAVVFGDTEVVVDIPAAEFGAWALELSLLEEGAVVDARIAADGAAFVFSLGPPATVRFSAELHGTTFVIALPREQCAYLRSVLLRAHRDDFAPVDHVHVEGALGGRSFDLTLTFAAHAAAMPGEEASKQILGDRRD